MSKKSFAEFDAENGLDASERSEGARGSSHESGDYADTDALSRQQSIIAADTAIRNKTHAPRSIGVEDERNNQSRMTSTSNSKTKTKTKTKTETETKDKDKNTSQDKAPRSTRKKGQVFFTPTAILAVRRTNDNEGYQLAVQWEGYDEPTWERVEALRNDRLVIELLLQDAFSTPQQGHDGGSWGKGHDDGEVRKELLGVRICAPQPAGEDEGVVARLSPV